MKRFILYILLMIVSVTLTAQNYAISGKVVDAENNKETLPYAQLRVFEKDTVQVATAVSDEDGNFVVKLGRDGDYRLSVSFLGYKTLDKKFKLTKKSPKLRMGKLQLSPDSKMLKEALV
ncbi:MAG: carboxypeptidase-like regulatory domain-containing protein, partial [Bacteroidaceae bacterium]|nr:carboxypeptidase-like regulatory domain-containing protein [Bacteroidaceae bacterium]